MIGHLHQRVLALSATAALLSACSGSSTTVSPALPSTHQTINGPGNPTSGGKHRHRHRLHHRAIVACPFSITSNFNGTAIPSGRTLWFSAVAKAKGLGTNPVTVNVTDASVSFTANGTPYAIDLPDSTIIFDPTATSATISYDPIKGWAETVPSSIGGNVLIDAGQYAVTSDLPGGIKNVTLTANFNASSSGVTLNWAWSAAAYSQFNPDNSQVGVKPVDDNQVSQYKNSDHAGTPESEKSYVVGGAMGGGGSNYTGGLSGTLAVTPCLVAPTAHVIFLTSGATWVVPSDWNSSSNKIEVIGAGGGGAPGAGGGGGYSAVSNATLTPNSSVTISIGSGGTGTGSNGNDAGAGGGGDTYVCNALNDGSNCASIGGAAVLVGAKGGGAGTCSDSPACGSPFNPVGGAGGSAALGVGTVRHSGGTGGGTLNFGCGGGGGGAAGSHGDGGAGAVGNPYECGGGGGGADNGTAGNDNAGGSGGFGGGDGGTGANGGTTFFGAAGGNGIEWDATHGSGGGGGGGAFAPGGYSGSYGGGGGGQFAGYGGGQTGASGIIVITYYG
jgi:hypothetical protein